MPSFTSKNETRTYSDVAQSVLIAKGVLSDLQIIVGESSVLHKIFQDSIKVAALWEGGKENLDFRMALNLLYADIICSAIINLKDDPGVRTPLIHMAKSDMARGSRALSRGKDALWELALADSMRKAAIKARLIDPPDIIADMSFGPYSIACKKFIRTKMLILS